MTSTIFQIGYNTLVVTSGITLLGIAAGVIGTFTFLRRRSLLSDALSHATLPGICAAFLLMVWFGSPVRSLPLLLAGAAISGIIGLLCVQAISRFTRLSEDAAIALVLSSFFGLGIVLLSIVQTLGAGYQAGLDSFIMGQAAAMSLLEATVIGVMAILAVVTAVVFYKELQLYSFDPDFAQGIGWSVTALDLLVAGLTVFVTVIGLQAVGLILVVALLIIPPVSARFWSSDLKTLLIISGLFGGVSALAGGLVSALYTAVPTGAAVVICAGLLFLVSLFLAPRRGMLAALWRRFRVILTIQSQRYLVMLLTAEEFGNSLAAMQEVREGMSGPYRELVWRRLIARGWIRQDRLTDEGRQQALFARRNLQLWEAYLWLSGESFSDRYQWGVDDIRDALSAETIGLLEQSLQSAEQSVS